MTRVHRSLLSVLRSVYLVLGHWYWSRCQCVDADTRQDVAGGLDIDTRQEVAGGLGIDTRQDVAGGLDTDTG